MLSEELKRVAVVLWAVDDDKDEDDGEDEADTDRDVEIEGGEIWLFWL